MPSLAGIKDGSELEAVDRCCTRKRLFSRMGEGITEEFLEAGDRGILRRPTPGIRDCVVEPELDRARAPLSDGEPRSSVEGPTDEVRTVIEGEGTEAACLADGRL